MKKDTVRVLGIVIGIILQSLWIYLGYYLIVNFGTIVTIIGYLMIVSSIYSIIRAFFRLKFKW